MEDINMDSQHHTPHSEDFEATESTGSTKHIVMNEWIRLALGSLDSLDQEVGLAAGADAVSEARAANVLAECSWQPTQDATPERMPFDLFQPMASQTDRAHQPKDSVLKTSWRLLSSKTYLQAALEISHLLATQTCAPEQSHTFPDNQFNWSENIQIVIGPKGQVPTFAATNAGVKHLNEIGDITSNISVCSSKMNNDCDSKVRDGEYFENITMGHLLGQPHSLDPSMNVPDFRKNHLTRIFNIINAELKSKLSNSNNCRNGKNFSTNKELNRIFSLGIVLYELFSGGKRPPELEKLQTDSQLFHPGLDPADDLRYDTLTQEQSRVFDLSSAFNILEDELTVHNLSHNSKSRVSKKEFSNNTTYDNFFKARINQNIDPPNSDETGSFVSSGHLSDGVSAFESEPTNLPSASELVDIFDSGKETESKCDQTVPRSNDASMIMEAGFGTNHMLNDIDDILVPCEESEAQNLPSAKDLLEGLDFDDDDIRGSNDVTASNKRAYVDSTFTQSAISVEPLKLMSVPGAICNLIANMIDSINGDLSGEDAYRTMEDVKHDIKWMMDHIDEILSNIDPNEALKSKLMTSNKFYGRESEISQLVDAYKKSSSQVSVAIISGPSGSGKTRLAQHIGLLSSMDGSIFLQGKYDQLQQSKPYSAISAAFDEYCNFLMAHPNLECRIAFANKLIDKIGQVGVIVLAEIVPTLKSLFDPSMFVHIPPNDCVNSQRRLQYLLSMFVEVISEISGACVILCLDDYQWADKSSFELVLQVIMRWKYSRKQSRLFFLMCYRDSVIGKEEWICSMENAGVDVTSIEMKGMDVGSVNTMISDLLCLLPRLTKQFSHIIHHKTQGNPLFVTELMKSLCVEKILFFSLSRRRWMWEIDELNARGVPDSVAVYLTTAMNKLPPNVKEALCVASCFGACIETRILEALESELNLELSGPLGVAVNEGMMDKLDGKFRFVHDQIQASAYCLMKPEERCVRHMNYGICLSSIALQGNDDSMLFTSVDQANRGGRKALLDKFQSLTVAQLNLRAGKKSVERSDFSTAFCLFDHGMSYLPRSHWKENYRLTMELHVGAIKCAVVTGEMTSVTILSDQVLKYARSFEDTLEVTYSMIESLEIVSQHTRAIEKGLSVLNQLGVKLLANSTSWKSDGGLFCTTKKMMQGFTDQDILHYKKMDDYKSLMTMKILGQMILLLFTKNPESQPEATLTMMQLSFSHGLSPLSPVAFVTYGSLLTVLGEIREGYRYAKIALQLLDQIDSKESASMVYGLASQVRSFVEPIQSLEDFTLEGYKIGQEMGDNTFSSLCMLFYNASAFFCGKNLQTVKTSVEDSLNLIGQYRGVSLILQVLPLYKSTLSMVGENEGITTLMGKCLVSRESEKEAVFLSRFPAVFKDVYFHKMYIAFMMRQYNEAKENAELYAPFSSKKYYSALFQFARNTFYEGLVSFWVARVSKENCWKERGERAISKLKVWADHCGHNFSNKLSLLEAERCQNLNDILGATRFYQAAIASAKRHKFLNEEALAYELAGYFSFDIGEREKSLLFLTQSSEKYLSWGAMAKVENVKKYIQENLTEARLA